MVVVVVVVEVTINRVPSYSRECKCEGPSMGLGTIFWELHWNGGRVSRNPLPSPSRLHLQHAPLPAFHACTHSILWLLRAGFSPKPPHPHSTPWPGPCLGLMRPGLGVREDPPTSSVLCLSFAVSAACAPHPKGVLSLPPLPGTLVKLLLGSRAPPGFRPFLEPHRSRRGHSEPTTESIFSVKI